MIAELEALIKLADMKQADPKTISYHMQSLLLCCCSPLTAAIDTLIKAHRFKMKLEVGGHQNPGYSLFISMAKRLGVDFEEVSVEADSRGTQYVWLSDHSTPLLRVWVPDMRNREGDFHVLCPFFFQYHLAELRKHEPEFPSPKVDNLYVLLLWKVCFGPHQIPISTKILKDLLAWEKREVLTAHSYIQQFGDEIVMVAEKAFSLKELAQLYMGFWTGKAGWDLVKGKDTVNHPINVRTRKLLDVMQPPASSVPKYPVFVCHYVWDIEQLNVITKNAWALDKYTLPDKEMTRQCLKLRAQGKSEEEIQDELGFATEEKYYKWQVNHFLDTATGRLGDVYQAWIKACEHFDLEPSEELLDCIIGTGELKPHSDTAFVNKVSVLETATVPPNEFRAEPDFRSVVSASGEQFSLTPRQSEVIRMLHEAFLNGTIDVSQARIIDEVYSQAKTNSLKKLFSNKDVWVALVQPGRRKGLFRLRVLDNDNIDD